MGIGGEAMFDGIRASVAVVVGDGTVYVPSLDDYLQHLRRHGKLARDSDLSRHPDLVEMVYRHWQCQPQIACEFARLIAKDPQSHGVDVTVVSGVVDAQSAGTAASATAKIIERAITKQGCEAVSVLIPGVLDVATLVALCHSLGAQPGWRCRPQLNPSDCAQRIYVELKVEVGTDNRGKTVLAEVLGFGPFEFLPLTRRAPITAVVLRAKPENAGQPKNPFKEPRAHLADLRINMDSRTFRRTWKASESARQRVLEGDDSAARARVTFAIPEEHWQFSATVMS